MKLTKHQQLKLSVMKALKDDEERQLQKDLLGALMDEAIPEEEEPSIGMREVAMPQLAQGAVAAIEAPKSTETPVSTETTPESQVSTTETTHIDSSAQEVPPKTEETGT